MSHILDVLPAANEILAQVKGWFFCLGILSIITTSCFSIYVLWLLFFLLPLNVPLGWSNLDLFGGDLLIAFYDIFTVVVENCIFLWSMLGFQLFHISCDEIFSVSLDSARSPSFLEIRAQIVYSISLPLLNITSASLKSMFIRIPL